MTPALLLMVGLGGMAGSYARYRFSGWVYSRTGPDFPWGTLAVNLSGSFTLGLLLPWIAAEPTLTPLRALINVGAIGAFTTFSTFAYEAVLLLQEGERLLAGLYVAASLGLGLLAIAVGILIGSTIL